jgi:glycosyltransferase involved in cell wall biosynthesis
MARIDQDRIGKVSIVMPVRDGQDRISERVSDVVNTLATLQIDHWELVIVDDGSTDRTAAVLDVIASHCDRIRIARHGRPRGMEAAGQTGLERSTGNLVFVQESDSKLRIEDLRTLLRMCEDESIVAARTESCPRPIAGALIRRLRAWGTNADQQFDQTGPIEKSSLQMIRRPHLQRLAGPHAHLYRLSGETLHRETVECV